MPVHVWSLDAHDTQHSSQHPGTQGMTQTVLDPSHSFKKVILKSKMKWDLCW